MRIQEIGGELGFISRIKETHAGAVGEGLPVSIGDDAAVIETEPGQQTVVTTDMLIERVHFRRDWSDPYSIGWKAAAVNLSDIAAMGGKPTYTFISLAITTRDTVEFLDRIYDGLVDCLNRYGSQLAGGDTNATPDNLVISITQLGVVAPGQALTRTGAKLGDQILVTGTLGDSAMGLALLSEYGLARAEKVSKELISAHRRPQPRVVPGRAAAATGKVHAAMDLSDGLLGDLKKLCAASNVGARIDTASLPLSEEMKSAAELLSKDAVQVATEGGEDYELLLIVPPSDVDEVREAIEATGSSVTVIGEILKTGLRLMAANGQDELPTEHLGWDHFVK